MIIFRKWYFVGVAGLGLCGYGVFETKLALQSGTEPIAVTMEELAGKAPLAQPYVRLGEHVELERLGVTHRAKRSKSRILYPLVGVDDPIVAALAQDHRLKSDLPGFAGLHVFALCAGDRLSLAARTVHSVEGTVFDFDGLSAAERNLVTLAVPDVDRSAVRVLEIGRRPKPLAAMIAASLAGLALIAFAVRLYRGPREPAAAEEEQGER